MTEINFYQIDDLMAKSLAPLLIKVRDEKKKAVVFCKNQIKFKEIDDGLWTYGKYKFIPHLTSLDKDIAAKFGWERQPILLTSDEVNLNKAEYLALIDEASQDFILQFERVFYLYESSDLITAKNLAKKLEKVVSKVNSYKKEAGKWINSQL